MPRVRSLLIALVALGLLAACTPAPAVTVSPTPVLQCTPESGGTPAPCSKTDYDAMVAKDALYAEAEAVYRKYFAEDVAMIRLGGADALTPGLIETTMGDFQAQSLDLYRSWKQRGYRMTSGDFVIAYIRRNVGESVGGSLVSLLVCADGSSAKLVEGGQPNAGTNLFLMGKYFFARDGAALKIAGSKEKAGTECFA